MAGVKVEVDLTGDDEAAAVFQRLNAFDRRGLHENLAFTGENILRRRITEEKAGPSGRWAPWSPSYARSRAGSGGSLLEASGQMVDSLTSGASDSEAYFGSNKAYAATTHFGDQRAVQVGPHQRRITQVFGRAIRPVFVAVKGFMLRRNTPARPWAYLSDANAAELRETAIAFLEAQAAG